MPVPEDIYKDEVDFTALAIQYPEFSKKLKLNRQLDFSDPESVRQLTKTLLHRDFGLSLALPEDRLCPPVPNRFNYILFAQRLIDSTRLDYIDETPSESTIIGFDIGTGASAIYPLLACRQRPTWRFLATEIDSKSRSYAQRNIKSNGLEERIKILDTDPRGKTLLPSSELDGFDDYSIRMQIVNPPFYSSETEMLESAQLKSRPPNSACTGAPVEMIVDGGEVTFVSRLIAESMLPQNRTKIQWFSSMLGKWSSVGVVLGRLREATCSNFAVAEFVQGQKTRRWCVAWSWLGVRPPTAIARGIPLLEKSLLPFPSEFCFDTAGQEPKALSDAIDMEISKLNLQWKRSELGDGGIGRSMIGDVWSRKARRRRQQDEDMKDVDAEDDSSKSHREPALAFRIETHQDSAGPHATGNAIVRIRWLQGHDAVLFESFCGWLKRKATS